MKFKDWDGNEVNLPDGKKYSWRPSAYALVKKDNKILMIKAICHGKWELPGGGIELNEKITEGLKREYFEETGYKITIADKNPLSVKEYYVKIADAENHILKDVYECNLEHPKVQNKPHLLRCGKTQGLFDFYAKDIDEYSHTITFLFSAELESDEQDLSAVDFEKEVKEIKWVDIEELENYEIAPLAKSFIDSILSK